MNHGPHPMSPADISSFPPKISKFCYIKKYIYRLHFHTKLLIILAFLESLRIVLVKKSYKFDDVSTNDYPRPSQNNDILK